MWAICRELKIPLDSRITQIKDIPTTISFVIRKRMQLDTIYELPEDKRPPELMIWDESVDTVNRWIREVMSGKRETKSTFVISEKDIEG